MSGANISEYSDRSSATMRNGKLSAAPQSVGEKRTLNVLSGGA